MASAAPTFHSTKETANYARLCRLLVDVSAHVLRETFEKKRPTGSLHTVLSSPPVRPVLQSLRRRVLNPLQWGKLYPAIKSSVSSNSFDITLLMVLLRNICGLVRPATGWDTPPSAADTTLEADIVRIKCYRNTVYGHASEASVDDATFSQLWKDIQDALVRLGGACYQGAIDDLKNECMDPDIEEHYQELLKQWVKDDVSIKERLDEIEELFRREIHDLKETIANSERTTGVEAVNNYTSALKASVKSQTEFQTKSVGTPTISSMKTDEIFTNMLIQHGRKPVDGLDKGRKKHLSQYGQVSGTRVEHCQEIFSSAHGSENPKSILLTGKAGIGKTLFCQKLVRDWANDKLFQSQTNAQIPNFKFAYLLTFRQLNLLRDERVTLREILNCSSVLDDHSNIDDSLFDYIINHSEEVLIVIDGYDEFSRQDYIAGNSDEQYPNNAQEKMPVAALCAKLIKRKILRASVVMITSRPDESDKIGRIRFDRYVEITGFSEQQVKEYIEKYFKDDENTKNTVLDHITKNDELISFAHIPVLCSLMCSYLEYKLKESISTDALPVKTSDLYFEVVNRFVLDHNKKEIPSEDTLDKLSKLAAELLLAKRFLFVEEDMTAFTLQEVESLRASGLLHCGPPFRKSFSQTTKHFCFTHLTLQEYLAARWFVKRREIPSLDRSSMVMQFLVGILSREKDKELMEQLLATIPTRSRKGILLRAKWLTEYQDIEFAKIVVKNHHHQFIDGYRGMQFSNLRDVDCIAVSFLLDVFSILSEEEAATKQQTFPEQPFIVERLEILCSDLTHSAIRRILKSLDNEFCTVTELVLYIDGDFTDECAECIAGLLSNKLTELRLGGGTHVTDAGIVTLCQALLTSTCKVTTLKLSFNQIPDAGIVTLCEALQTSTCKVSTLDLRFNQITDSGVATLCQALQTSTCKVTTLYLRGGNLITEAGKNSLRNLQQQQKNLKVSF